MLQRLATLTSHRTLTLVADPYHKALGAYMLRSACESGAAPTTDAVQSSASTLRGRITVSAGYANLLFEVQYDFHN